MSLGRLILPEGRLYFCNRLVAYVPIVWFRMWFYRKIMKFEIADDATIFMGAWFYCAGGLKMGRGSVINENCRLDTRGKIILGNNVVLTAMVTILTADHNPQNAAFSEDRSRQVVVEDYVFLGTGATVLPGITLGRGSMVGACSVVTKDVPPYAIVAGNPARVIGERPHDLSYGTYYRRIFH